MRRLGTLAAAITLLFSAPASADTFTVNTAADTVGGPACPTNCTIRNALAAANANGPTTEDLIVVPANTYQLAFADLPVNSRVVISGVGARSTVIVASTNTQFPVRRVFNVTGDQVTIRSLTMQNGQAATLNGGNLVNAGGAVVLDHVRVTGGGASNGGGLSNENGSMTIRSSLIHANAGGGVYSSAITTAPSSLNITDSTIALNSIGPGIQLNEDGQPSTGRLERVTVARNDSTSDPGGIEMATPGAVRARASIVAANTGDSGGDVNCSGPLTSEGANIESDADCGLSATTGDLPSTDAGLSANLEDAGGQTNAFTIGSTSPAFNRAGACAGSDQRDLLRPQGGLCDSGAYEVDQAPDTTVVATPPTFAFSSSEPGVSFQCRIDRPGRPGTFAACTSPASYASLRQGSYSFVVRAVDSGGTADPSPAVASFVVQPQATAGKFVLVKEVRGRVRVKRPGGKYVNLSKLTEIPDGSLVDTRKGVVRLSFQATAGGKVQKAKFWDGIFKVDQRKKIMELVLVEKLAKCAQQGNATTAAKKKKSRRLWGDGKGRFRTKGQYSSATVRGTRWLTQDSCAGTLTRVRKGKVNVLDFVRKRTIRLKKGQQYLARPG